MSLRLLLDEMYPAGLAERLRAAGVDTVAVLDIHDLVAATDVDVLQWSHQAGRAVVTENVRHLQPLATTATHSGLVLLHGPRWPRTNAGQARIAAGLVALDGSGYRQPEVRWLQP